MIMEESTVKMLLVYDSTYGNTEKIAQSIDEVIGGQLHHAGEADPSDLTSLDLLIVGSPTHAFRATTPVQTFIKRIPRDALTGVDVAAFDTRMHASDVGMALRFFMKIGGYAAPRIAKALTKKGGTLVVQPEGFFVTDKEGPLKEGELERAAGWAKTMKV